MDLINNPLLVVLAGIAIVALIFWYVATEIDRRKRNVGTIAILLVIGLCLAAVLPFEDKLKGGIDLKGGAAFTVEIQPAAPDEGQEPIPVGPEAIEAVKQTLSERLSAGSMDGVQMQGLGTNRLVIEMPDVNEEETARVRSIIEKTAQLTCKAVHPESDRLARAIENGSQLTPSGWKLYYLPILDEETRKKIGQTPILLAKRNIVTGDLVQRAIPIPSRFGMIQVTLNSDGGDRLFNATSKMESGRDRMAVVLDGEALIAPVVNGNLSKTFD